MIDEIKVIYMTRRAFFILLTCLVLINSVIFVSRVFSYDTYVAHPLLTEKIAQNYNNNFDRKLTNEEINWLKQGSIEEDIPIRWLNHFYEPNFDSGLGSFTSAKNWAQSPNLQSAYVGKMKGDQSWQKAIDSYINGDNRASFIALGHILHLIEDMTVPAHTRSDAHPEGDPYEEWGKINSTREIKTNSQKITANNLSEVFDRLASYSNRYFFSKDTINKKILDNLEIKTFFSDGKFIDCYIYKDNANKEFCLISSDKNFVNPNKKVYYFTDKNHSDYFSLLSPRAVSYGAGVIKLFFEEVEKKKQEEAQKSWWEKTKNWLNDKKKYLSSSLLNVVGTEDGQNVNSSEQGITIDQTALNNLANQQQNAEQSKENQIVSVKPEFNVQADNSSAQNSGTEIDQQTNNQQTDNKQQNNQNNNENLESKNQSDEQSSDNENQSEEVSEEFSTPNNPLDSTGQANSNNNENSNNENSSLPPGSSIGTSRRGAQTNEDADSNATSTPANLDIIPPQTFATSTLFSNNEITATSTAIFEFSSSEVDSTFECQLDNASSTPCASPIQYNNLVNGSYTFNVKATDQSGNSDQTPEVFNWIVDTTAPGINLILSNYNLISTNFSVGWNSSSTNVSSYEIQYKISSNGQWEDWVSSTAAGQQSFQATYDDTTYYFRGRTTNDLGIQSVWQEINTEISLNPVVINEIAWMGNSFNSADEWVELYNKTSQDINLNGWRFNAAGTSPTGGSWSIEFFLTGIIPAHGFYLLERSDDNNTISDVFADQIYNGALNNDGGILELRDNNSNLIDSAHVNLIDSTPPPFSYNWSAGEGSPSYKTMERINPYILGFSQNNWATNDGITINGLAADGITIIKGTPKAQNSRYDANFSAGTIVPDTTVINRNTIWGLKGSPYLLGPIYSSSPTISAGATLIIEPGVVVKPQNKYRPNLIIKGTLLAEGTENQKIKFTSQEDSPQSGDWGAIVFDTKSSNSVLDNVIFEYGGYQNNPANCYFTSTHGCQPTETMIVIYDSKVQIKNSIFRNAAYGGIYLSDSDSEIINCSFSDGLRGVIIRDTNSQATISGSTFQNQNNSGIGIEIYNDAAPDISSNTISGYQKAIYLNSAYPTFSQNTALNNSYNGIFVDCISLFLRNVFWQNNLPYLLVSVHTFEFPLIATGTVLTIEPGTVIKLLNKYTSAAFKIDGELKAEGTEDRRIIFTSFKDDSFGGDANNDGGASLPDITGDWRNIFFSAGSRASLKHVVFKYGGFSPYLNNRIPDETLLFDPTAEVVQGEGVVIE